MTGLFLALVLACRADDARLRKELGSFVSDGATVDSLVRQVRDAPVGDDGLLADLVADNLAARRRKGEEAGRPYPLSVDEIQREVIGYEAFKLQSYVSSGVFPKRYFGYLDNAWDTAEQEQVVLEAVSGSVRVANAWLALNGHGFRLTDAQVAVTFLAEGGALMLDHAGQDLRDLHPIMDVGLDSLAFGLRAHPGLAAALDEALGTALGQTLRWQGEQWEITRGFDLRESVVGTAFMLVYQEALLAADLAREGRTPLEARPLDEQFILVSLHYNSGLVFSDERVLMIRDFQTGAYLDEVSRRNEGRRPLLPVLPPEAALAALGPVGVRSYLLLVSAVRRCSETRIIRRMNDTSSGAWERVTGEARSRANGDTDKVLLSIFGNFPFLVRLEMSNK